MDGSSAREYEEHLDEHLADLVARLKSQRYRAQPVKRVYIPKDSGGQRPVGIPASADKVVPMAVKGILAAIYEQDFLRCSYGYRPGKGAHAAVDKLTVKLQFRHYNYVIEADIQAYFENLDHEWLCRMLEQRIADRPFIRLIRKWLKAGLLDTDRQVLHPHTGTPQGGIVSPVLANV